jgi:hypothetical protein
MPRFTVIVTALRSTNVAWNSAGEGGMAVKDR